MKNVKLFLTGLTVFAIIGGAFAFKIRYFGSGSVYCARSFLGTCNNRVNFRVNCCGGGTSIRPCGSTGGVENASYIYDEVGNCVQNNLGLTYDAVSVGK